MADHELRARIFAAIDGTKTARQVADELGVDLRRVHTAAKQGGMGGRLVREHRGLGSAAAKLMDGTRTAKEISEITGLSLGGVYVAARRRGLSGRLVEASKLRRADGIAARFGVSPALAEWLRGQCGAGVGVADVIRGILTDAYLDETEGGDE